MKLILSSLFMILLSTNAQAVSFSDFIPEAWIDGEHKKIIINDNNGIEYPTVRLKHETGAPVVLLHGLANNAHGWMDLAPLLHEAGYDVWSISWAAHDERNIHDSGQFTVAEIVDYVREQTGKKPFLVGHSLGGMLVKIYALGLEIDSDTGKAFHNKKLQKSNAKKIKGIVSVASPNGTGMKSYEEYSDLLEKMFSVVGDMEGVDLSEALETKNPLREKAIIHSFEAGLFFSRLPLLDRLLKGFLFNMKFHKFFDYDLGRVARYGFGGISSGIQRDMITLDGFLYTDFYMNTKRLVPVAFIGCTADSLAKVETIREEVKGSAYLELKDAGHMDPIMGEYKDITTNFMIKFFQQQY